MHNLDKIQNLEHSKHNIILDNLFYILCGIDTTYLSIGLRNKKYALIINGDYPYEYLHPFENIIINVRIIHKFIIKGSYPMKRIIGEFFLTNLKRFFDKISKLRRSVSDIETLYVNIKEDIRLFDEFRFIIDSSRNKEEIEIYNFIRNTCNKDYYKCLIDDCYMKIEEDVIKWVTRGTVVHNFMIKECMYNKENIENGFWKSKYELNNKQIPDELVDSATLILQCGKLINLNKILGNSLNLDYQFFKEKGLHGAYSYLKDTTYALISRQVESEISVLEKYVLMNDMSFYNDLFIDLYNDKSFNISNDFSVASPENKKFLFKVNMFKKFGMIKFKMADLDLNNTIYKILGTNLQIKNNQSILEFLTIDFHPKILGLIITKKDILELELIFRFLFTLSVIQFFLQRCYKYRFSKLVLHFIHNFKFTIYTDPGNISFACIDTLVNDISSVILKYLNNLFLVSGDIYLIISEIIDLSFNFISLDNKDECINIEEFENRFVTIIRKLYGRVKKLNSDWWLINTLECLMDDNFMKRREK
ncbi:hypothetical protein P3W45_001185 [Vairimorpha bombi]|jgi:gamma-tubulin complex component 2